MKLSFAGIGGFAAILILTGLSRSQVATGIQQFGSYAGGPFDTVNLGNLNIHFAVPIRHKAGRGVPFAYDLTYDNSIWQIGTSSGHSAWLPVQQVSGFGSYWGWQGLGPTVSPYVGYSVQVTNGTCFNGSMQVPYTQWNFSNFSYFDAQGGGHFVGGTAAYIQSQGGSQCPPNGPQPTTGQSFPASDGSGYTVNLNVPGAGSITGNITAGDGSTLSAPFLTSPPSSSSPFTTTDRNGNEITETNGIYTDTLGTTVLTVAGGQPNNTTFSYLAPNQQNTSYTVSYKPYTVQTAFGCSIQDYPATAANLVDKIKLPDSSLYQFQYEVTPGDNNTPHHVTGRISQITLPTGGTITYTYGATNCADGTAELLTRQLDSNTPWQYSRALAGSDSHWQTTITDPTPAANQTVIDFESSFYETRRVVHSGAATNPAIATTVTCYNNPESDPSLCPIFSVTPPILERIVFNYAPDTTGVASKTDTSYQNGDMTRPVEIDSYDFGAKGAGPPSVPTRKVLNNLNYFVGGAGFSTGVTVEDGNNNIFAQTTYAYDETTPTPTTGTPQHITTTLPVHRGNVTTASTKVSGSVTLYRKFTYYDTGMPNTMTDAGTTTSGGPNLTTYVYDNSGTAPHTKDCGNSFVTTIEQPLSLQRSFSWDCDGGVMTSSTDENGQTATVSYTGTGADAFFWRPFQALDQSTPANATKFTYPSAAAAESRMLFNGSNSASDHRSTLDDFGRSVLSQTQQTPGTGPGTGSYDSVETSYDAIGRVSKIFRPYSAAADTLCSGTCPGTTTTYDALSRPLTVTDAGTGAITYAYNWNDVHQTITPAPTGEHTKQKQIEYSALGWPISVCETTSVAGSGACGQNNGQNGFLTTYTYDPSGNLLAVSQNAQPGASATQSRNYTFDMMSRLTSELNPETGTTAITYIYDSWDAACGSYTSAGDLVEKKDAMGNVACIKYDALHRTTDITYPSGTYASATDQKHFVYDAATVHSVGMVNAKARLAEAYTGSSAAKKTDEGFSYSARGEVVDVYESTPNSSGYYHVNATYWPNGNLNVLNGGTSPLAGLPAITYGGTGTGIDGEGRITKVNAATGQNPVTSVSYNVAQQVTAVTFGSADSDVYQYDNNTGRMTKYTFNMGTGPTTQVGTLTWNPNGTLGQLQIADQINSANSQTCTFGYDDLVRITSANCGTVWSQTFGLDPFGNLTKSGSANFNPIYDMAHNQYTSIPGGSTTSYDPNGNLTNDVTHSYSWDADGNMLSTDGSAVTTIYDAMDRMIEQTRGAAHTQIVYGPTGIKLALMNSQTLLNAFVKLPGGARAVYNSSSLAYYRHSDHLGSSRLETTTSRTKQYDVAYGPYGEDYNGSGTQDLAFTDENQDTIKNGWTTNLYDFMLREYRTAHGRWASPDPSGLLAVDPSSPQSWNRYAYVVNNPLAMVDLLGDDGCYDSTGVQVGSGNQAQCEAAGYTWLSDGMYVLNGNIYQYQAQASQSVAMGSIDSNFCPNCIANAPTISDVITYGSTLIGSFYGLVNGEAAIVEEPGTVNVDIGLQIANRNAGSLSQAVNSTGLQNLKNPCTTAAFLATGVAAGGIGVGIAQGAGPALNWAVSRAFGFASQMLINTEWNGLRPGAGIGAFLKFYGGLTLKGGKYALKAGQSACNAMQGK